jgi:hypothetical protein
MSGLHISGDSSYRLPADDVQLEVFRLPAMLTDVLFDLDLPDFILVKIKVLHDHGNEEI